jgi:tRNA nucleotidyltransferase/poly(A) polymerase
MPVERKCEMNHPNLYMVGGAVRDLLLFQGKVKSSDVDFVLETNSWEELMEYVKDCKYHVYTSNPEYGTVKVKMEGGPADISIMNGNYLEEDLKRRDFTINAMAIKVGETDSFRALYDPLNGAEDLRRGVIRMCSREAFKRDPIRILRMFRFSYMLGAKGMRGSLLDSDTLQEAKTTAHTLEYEQSKLFSREKTLKAPTAERVVQELNKIFKILPTMSQRSNFLGRGEVEPFLTIPGVDLKFILHL